MQKWQFLRTKQQYSMKVSFISLHLNGHTLLQSSIQRHTELPK